MINDMGKAWMRPDWKQMCENYMMDEVTLDANKSIEWIKQHKAPERVRDAMVKWLKDDVTGKPITRINVHLKLESLLKSKPIFNWE